MNKYSALILLVVMGICVALQPLVNAGLGKVITPRLATFHSLITSGLIMAVIVLFTADISTYKLILKTHPIYWIGGVLGIVIVFVSVIAIPVVGAATSFSVIIVVQLVAGLLIDHFGILGVPQNSVNIVKIAGVALILLGMKLIMYTKG